MTFTKISYSKEYPKCTMLECSACKNKIEVDLGTIRTKIIASGITLASENCPYCCTGGFGYFCAPGIEFGVEGNNIE